MPTDPPAVTYRLADGATVHIYDQTVCVPVEPGEHEIRITGWTDGASGVSHAAVIAIAIVGDDGALVQLAPVRLAVGDERWAGP